MDSFIHLMILEYRDTHYIYRVLVLELTLTHTSRTTVLGLQKGEQIQGILTSLKADATLRVH